MITVTLNGTVIRNSKNLRGMRDYARVSCVTRVDTRKRNAHDNDPAGVLTVTYENGAQSIATFASYNIMVDFVRNRRTWRGAAQTFPDGNIGYLTKPGIIAGP